MNVYGVSENKEKALNDRMANLGLREQDIAESFVRSGGKGGQHVNKVSTCVQLRHRPSGLEVKCQKGRSQALNRYYARVLLADKFETLVKGRESAEQQRREKIRRQKRKRSKRAQEKILADKHAASVRKTLRARVRSDEA